MSYANKLLVIGLLLIVSGTILLGFMHLAIVIHMPNLGWWSTPPGKFFTILKEGYIWFPYSLSIIQIIVGIVFVTNSFSLEKKLAFNAPNIQNEFKIQGEITFDGAKEASEPIKQFISNNYLTDGKSINGIFLTPFENYYVVDVEGVANLVVLRKNLALPVTDAEFNEKQELKRWFETHLKQ